MRVFLLDVTAWRIKSHIFEQMQNGYRVCGWHILCRWYATENVRTIIPKNRYIDTAENTIDKIASKIIMIMMLITTMPEREAERRRDRQLNILFGYWHAHDTWQYVVYVLVTFIAFRLILDSVRKLADKHKWWLANILFECCYSYWPFYNYAWYATLI